MQPLKQTNNRKKTMQTSNFTISIHKDSFVFLFVPYFQSVQSPSDSICVGEMVAGG